MTVYLTVQIINPTKISVSFKKPDIWIYYNGSELASSKLSSQTVKLEKQGSTYIRDIALKIPLTSNIPKFVDMAKKVFQNVSNTNEGIFSQIASNATAIMPLLEVKLLTYVGSTPIEYKTALG